MNHLLTLASAAVLAAFGVSAAAPAQTDASAIPTELDQAINALRGISTLRADFTQTDRSGQRVSGVLTLKRPGRIRFQYSPETRMLLVSDGKALNFIDYEVRQVQRWPIGNTPLGALLDPNKDVARFGKLQPTTDPSVISVEVRDPRHREYGVITLIFVRKASAPGGLELATWVMLDSQNKRTTIRLTNHQYGIPVADSAFTWNDPRQSNRR
jgi:outer membrane lipoprotein-sorting protein